MDCTYKPIQNQHPRVRKDIIKVKPTNGVVIVYGVFLKPIDEISGRFKVASIPVIVQGEEYYQIVRNYQPVREIVLVSEVEHV